jgi:hypothetical protein
MCASVLALTLAVSATPASAAPSANSSVTVPRGVGQIAQRMFSMMRSGGLGGAAARRGPLPLGPGTIFSDLTFTSHDPTYKDWEVGAAVDGDNAYLAFATYQEQSGGLEAYEWIKQVPRQDVGVGGRLLHFEIHSGTDLGALGSIDLSFQPSHVARSLDRCPSTGKVIDVYRNVEGTFTGTVSLSPDTPGLPSSVQATGGRGSVEQDRLTGNSCPQSYLQCPIGRRLVIHSGPSTLFLYSRRFANFNEAFVQSVTVTETDAVFFYREALSSGDPSQSGGFSVTRTNLTVNGDAFGAPFSGSVTFDRSSPAVGHVGNACRSLSTPFEWHDGSISIAFDPGPVTYTGASEHARLRWVSRA